MIKVKLLFRALPVSDISMHGKKNKYITEINKEFSFLCIVLVEFKVNFFTEYSVLNKARSVQPNIKKHVAVAR